MFDMEKISIGTSERMYEIESVKPIQDNILQLIFNGAVPSKFGDINLYTAGGVRCTTLTGYHTVYRDEGVTVYLSNDGSVYQEPEDPGSLPEKPYEPSLSEVKEIKKTEVNTACNTMITNGFGVVLMDGTAQRFSLKEEDQIALLTCASMVMTGEKMIPWHPNGDKTQPCVFYSNADMKIITDAAYFHRSYHTTYCNALKVWIESCEDVEQLQEIFYGADVPENYRSEVLQAYLIQIVEMAGDSNEAVD